MPSLRVCVGVTLLALLAVLLSPQAGQARRVPSTAALLEVQTASRAEASRWSESDRVEQLEAINHIRVAFGFSPLNADGSLPVKRSRDEFEGGRDAEKELGRDAKRPRIDNGQNVNVLRTTTTTVAPQQQQALTPFTYTPTTQQPIVFNPPTQQATQSQIQQRRIVKVVRKVPTHTSPLGQFGQLGGRVISVGALVEADSQAKSEAEAEASVGVPGTVVTSVRQLLRHADVMCGSRNAWVNAPASFPLVNGGANLGARHWPINGYTYWREGAPRYRVLGMYGPLNPTQMALPRQNIPSEVTNYLDALFVPNPANDEEFQRNRANWEQGHILADSLGGTTHPANFFPQSEVSNSQTGTRGLAEMVALHLQNYCAPVNPGPNSKFTQAIQNINPPSGVVHVWDVLNYANAPGGDTARGPSNNWIPTGGSFSVAIKIGETRAGTRTAFGCGARLATNLFCRVAHGNVCASTDSGPMNQRLTNPIPGGQWKRVRLFWRRCVETNLIIGTGADRDHWCVWTAPWTNNGALPAGNNFSP